jgi:hypothetical protein
MKVDVDVAGDLYQKLAVFNLMQPYFISVACLLNSEQLAFLLNIFVGYPGYLQVCF